MEEREGYVDLYTNITAANNNPSLDNILPIISRDDQTDKIEKSDVP